MIWGHHPHVLQKMTWIKSSKDGHNALVLYSMGNLLSDQFMLPDAQHSALVGISIHKDKIDRITVIPVMFNTQTDELTEVGDPVIREIILDRLDSESLARENNRVQIFVPPLE